MWMCHRAERYEVSCEKLLWLMPKGPQPLLLLLSCGGDGWMRVWHITQSARLVCTQRVAQGRLDQISAICTNEDNSVVICGDTSGHLRVWDISEGITVSSTERCRDAFKQVAHWRAHDLTITAVDCLKGQRLLVASCRDTNVSLWSWEGCLVGILGLHTFRLDDPGTWQDAAGANRREPMGETESMYLQAGAGEDDGSSGQGGDGDGMSRDLLLQVQRQRARDSLTQRPQQLHAQLRLHPLQEVPQDVRTLFRSTAARDKAAAMRSKSPSRKIK